MAEFETAVYSTEKGYIALKQIDRGDEEDLVLLSPAQARLIAEEMVRLADEDEYVPEDEE
ncbi:hypothetical protein [Pseudomonas typographi]|uniref:hypothetical protein n=1 Tax=Pseudomonas typographi TaxID=2715964 RepID=UPI001689E412|nr:hypothetical protein [Pseudomonas typographi]MBD1589643.1 hypothetical protein [Pseudomonas typographi]